MEKAETALFEFCGMEFAVPLPKLSSTESFRNFDRLNYEIIMINLRQN